MYGRIFSTLFVCVLLVAIVGCGFVGGDTAGGDKKTGTKNSATETTGIPECDEVFDEVNKGLSDSKRDPFTQSIQNALLSKVKDEVRSAIEKHSADTKETAKECRQLLDALRTSEAEAADAQK